jgi:uncharacterized protein YndB with AHSA1/START domain
MTVESIGKRRRIVRTYPTSLERAWELWTTPDGIASWWGPEGFHIEVHRMELVPGGVLEYSMITEDEGIKAYLAEQGMPASHLATIRYSDVVPMRRLAYAHVVDFIPDVERYEVTTLLELEPTTDGVRLTLTLDAMHSDEWTDRAVAGWVSELDKLDRLVAAA